MIIEHIAQGGAFDSTEAIRALAIQMSLNRKLLADNARLLAQLQQTQAQPLAVTSGAPSGPPQPDRDLERLTSAGIPIKAAALLVQAGYTELSQVYAAANDELAAIDGIGPATIALIRRKLKDFIPS
jgi:hypothetical protein